jgi:hypothetical protein
MGACPPFTCLRGSGGWGSAGAYVAEVKGHLAVGVEFEEGRGGGFER